MKIDHICTKCESKNIRVRTSQKIGLLVVEAVGYCIDCGTELKVQSQIIRVRTPSYTERPEALRVNKVLNKIDERQLELDTE